MIKNDELCRKTVFTLNLFIPGSVSWSLSQRPSASKSYVRDTLLKNSRNSFIENLIFGISWCHSRLRIWRCHCYSLGCFCGVGSVPGPGNFHMLWAWPKLKLKLFLGRIQFLVSENRLWTLYFMDQKKKKIILTICRWHLFQIPSLVHSYTHKNVFTSLPFALAIGKGQSQKAEFVCQQSQHSEAVT